MPSKEMTVRSLQMMMTRNDWKKEDVACITVRALRTINRWLSGESPIPMTVVAHLRNVDGKGISRDWWQR